MGLRPKSERYKELLDMVIYRLETASGPCSVKESERWLQKAIDKIEAFRIVERQLAVIDR